ncbi:MAG: DUF2281 domain-containing protein [Pirellulales bacterium]
MSTVDIHDASTSLPEIIAGLVPGEHVTIVSNGVPLATLTRNGANAWPCRAGSAKDTKHWMSPDFDAPLDDFGAYTP